MDSSSKHSSSKYSRSYNNSSSPSKRSHGRKKGFNSKKKKRLNHKLFIGGLPPKLDNDELIDYFEKFGELYEAEIMFDKDTNKSRGFAFVTYKEASVAMGVLERPHIIHNKKVDVKIAYSKSKARTKILHERERKIFVGGLSPETTEAQLQTYFEQFGSVESANIIVEPNTRKSRGFGFIVFYDRDTIDEVLNHRDKHFLNKKWVDCKPALLREEIKKPTKKDKRRKNKKTRSEAPKNLQKYSSEEENDEKPEKPTKSTGLSLPGPISHHPHELYSEEAFSDHQKSFHSRQANYNNQQSVGYSPMNFRPANNFYHNPQSAGPSPMAFPRPRPRPHNQNWGDKFNQGMTPSTASGQSPLNRYYGESPAFHPRGRFIKPRLMETTTPKEGFGGYYRNQNLPITSPYVRSAQNKFSQAPKNAHNFSTYFQQNEIIEDEEESD